MAQDYRVVVNAIITFQGKILLGKKEEVKGHPISGEWHFPGGHLENGEEPEEAVKREVKEETSLEVEVHQIVDATSQTWNEDKVFQVTFHCESEGQAAEPEDDLEDVKWVNADNVRKEAGDFTRQNIDERHEVEDLIERIKKAPY